MALASILNLEDLIAKCNMDISKLQEDIKVAEDWMKAMEEDKRSMWNSYYFGVVTMCKWWLKKFSNGVVAKDPSKTKMGDTKLYFQLWYTILVKLEVLGEKTLFSSMKSIDRDLVEIKSHNKLYNGRT